MTKTGQRKVRNQGHLQSALTHFDYEVSMLSETARLVSEPNISNTPLENSLLESFTVHARALTHFFFPAGRVHDEDVLAEDYFSHPATWDGMRGSVPVVLTDVRSRVGTEIAHLSYARLSILPAARGWNIKAIVSALAPLIDVFKNNADRLSVTPAAKTLLVATLNTSATNDIRTSVSSPSVNPSVPGSTE
jgi:hypothetical protein